MSWLLRKIIGWFNDRPIYKIYLNGKEMYLESSMLSYPESKQIYMTKNLFSSRHLLILMNKDLSKYDLWMENNPNDYLVVGGDWIPIHDGDRFYTALKEINNN